MSACARAWVIARPDASVEHALFDHLVCVTSFLSLSRIAKRGHSQETAKLSGAHHLLSDRGAVQVLEKWRRARDSNPQGPRGPVDFKFSQRRGLSVAIGHHWQLFQGLPTRPFGFCDHWYPVVADSSGTILTQ
jgi:hypothetical protein